jgi:SAM-dependent methyltransferase
VRRRLGVRTALGGDVREHPVEAVFAVAFRGHPCVLAGPGAERRDLPANAWSASIAGDALLLDLCEGPTLDVGCGPGRMTQQLAERGGIVLGIDVVPEAVWQTRGRGAGALLRDVFDRVPAEGRWHTVLLADGNLGIGGDPVRLLRRVARLLVPGGRVVADVAPPGTGLRSGTVQLAAGGLTSEPFSWAVVGADAVDEVAVRAGFTARTHSLGRRWVSTLHEVAS